MTRSQSLFWFLVSFFCGVAIGSVFPWWSMFFGLVGLMKRAWFVLTFGFFLGFLRIVLAFPSFETDHVGFYRDIPTPLTLKAEVVSDPEIRNDAQYLVVEAGEVNGFKVHGKVQLKLWRFPEYEYGDALLLEGSLQKPAEFETFSYADYLAKDDIYAVMYSPRVRLIEGGGLSDGWSLVFWLKHNIRERVELLFEEPGASIVLGLLLGMRSSIPQSMLDAFQRSGLTHILAISGYNITLLITIVGLILSSFGRRFRFAMIWVSIAFFAVLTGLSASVVRASIMGALTVFTLSLGRKTDGLLVLLLSGFFMVFASPRILVWDVSFQLSFVSTLGLMTLMPLFELYGKKLPLFLRESLLVTLAATVFTAPVVLYHFGTFSLISPFANVVFLPLIPLIMLFSFCALVGSLFFYPFAVVWIGICWVALFLLIEGVQVVASVPLAFVKIPTFPWWAVGLYYFLLWRFISSHTPRLGRGSSRRRVDASSLPAMGP